MDTIRQLARPRRTCRASSRPDSSMARRCSGPVPLPPGAIAVETPDQARFAVDALAQSGVDFLKVYNSVPRDAYFALAAEARAIGIPFAGHVPEAVSPAEAADAGQRSEEHLINILLACSTREDELRAARVAAMLDPIHPRRTAHAPAGISDPAALSKPIAKSNAANLFRTFVRNGTWHTPTLVLLKASRASATNLSFAIPIANMPPKSWTDSLGSAPHVFPEGSVARRLRRR